MRAWYLVTVRRRVRSFVLLDDLFRCREPLLFAVAPGDVDRDGGIGAGGIGIAGDFEAALQEHFRDPLPQFRFARLG